MSINVQPFGDQAILVEFGSSINEETNKEVRKFSAHLDASSPEWMIEYIPAFTTVTIIYDPLYISHQVGGETPLPYEWAQQRVEELLSKNAIDRNQTDRTIEIPVSYGGDLGPDLSFVAAHNKMSEEEVIKTHMAGDYLVYMIGFAPGFPYIGGMDEKIAAPRRGDPRLAIPAGSVGIAGSQTGVYPIETPGGWQLIGCTPLRLFQAEKAPPSLLQAGDHIKFTRISEDEYKSMKEDER
ncbi:5-oxoprolinase subunit PxpB [Halobacillus litoralis]|uniref:5-oxoprolinase subunit PxpB n=1 Tax=Halobacillus litoralis TaxID=45668 RepID=UPI002492F657|nr:5-oxoprolinase subunit PxpB [Halobacillus litoralis]